MTSPTPSAPRAMRGRVSLTMRLISNRLLCFGLWTVLACGLAPHVGALRAQVVQLPLSCESLRAEERAALDRAFQGINVCMHMAAGSLTPGETYDLSLPPNRFNRQYYLWLEQLNADESIHSISTDEIIKWDRVEQEFERLRKWAERRRKGQP